MKTRFVILSCAAALLLALVTRADDQSNKRKIGVYDSRAVAVAFAGSEVFKQSMAPVYAEYEKARKEGDTAKIKAIKERMSANQTLRHKQAFSTAPVDDVLKHIENRLPAIQKDAGVDALVSKWDNATLERYKDAEKVDITMRLVDEFHPNDRQRKYAVDIQKHKPISLKEAENIKD